MENHIPDLIRHYLKGLEERDEAAILSLFAVEGIVLSPLYGRRRAKDFYPGLFADTGRSVISLHHILRDTYRPDVAAAYFRYDWTLRNGTSVSFECVDVFYFDRKGKIGAAYYL